MRDRIERAFYWVAALILFVIAAFVLYRVYLRYSPLVDHLDPRLPLVFHGNEQYLIFWAWVLVLGVVGAIWFRRAWRRYREAAARLPGDESDEPGDPEQHAILPPGTRPDDPVYLFLGPSSEAISDLLFAAHLDPRGSSALALQPTRAALVNATRLVEDGLTLDSILRSLAESDAGAPPLRGVFVVLPIDWLVQPDPGRRARAFGAAVRSIRDGLKLESPVYVVVTGLQGLDGFAELAASLGGAQTRWGVSLAGSSGGEPSKSLARFWETLRRKTLDLMARDFADQALNARYYATAERLGSARPRRNR